MSSPSRTFSAPLRGPRTKEGLAYDDEEPFEASRLLSRHVGRAASGDSPRPSHCAAYHARSVVTGSYGKIVLPVMDKPQPGRHRPALWQDGKRRGCARFASIRPKIPFSASGADAAAGRCNHPVCPSIQ